MLRLCNSNIWEALVQIWWERPDAGNLSVIYFAPPEGWRKASKACDDRMQERPLRTPNPNQLWPLPRIDLVSMCHVRAPRTLPVVKSRNYICVLSRDMSEENYMFVSSSVPYLHTATDRTEILARAESTLHGEYTMTTPPLRIRVSGLG